MLNSVKVKYLIFIFFSLVPKGLEGSLLPQNVIKFHVCSMSSFYGH